jgi:hypothetical protein
MAINPVSVFALWLVGIVSTSSFSVFLSTTFNVPRSLALSIGIKFDDCAVV